MTARKRTLCFEPPVRLLSSMWIISIFLLCALVPKHATGQQVPRKTAIGPVTVMKGKRPAAGIRVFGTEQGLALSSFYSAIKDSNGNLWFATYGAGVSKYDGRTFSNYNTSHGLAHNVVSCMATDRYGDIWFGTFGGGVSRYDGISFKTLSTKDGLAQDMVRSIVEDPMGRIWFGTFDKGISIFNGHTFRTITTSDGLPSDNIWSIITDKSANIFVGTDKGVSIFDGKRFSEIPQMRGKFVRAMLSDSKGRLWFGTAAEGAYCIEKAEVKHYSTSSGMSDNAVWTITEDSSGDIWIGTEGGGVSIFDGSTFSVLTTREGLTNNNVRSIIEGNPGTLWLATYGGGVNRYDGNALLVYENLTGLPDFSIGATFQDHQGNIWFGSSKSGVIKFDGEDLLLLTESTGLPPYPVTAIAEDSRHSLWFATRGGGIIRFDGSSFTSYTTDNGLPNDNVNSLLFDRDGSLWLGTDEGLAMLDRKGFTSFSTKDGLANKVVWDILQDRIGQYWFATFGGLTVYNGKTFRSYDTRDGLCSNTLVKLHEDQKGNIFIGGTDGGLSRYDGKSFITMTLQDGLPDETVYDIDEGFNGELWIGTNAGLSRLSFVTKAHQIINGAMLDADNAALRSQYTLKTESYSTTTGYRIKDVNGNAMVFTRIPTPAGDRKKGVIWAGCGDNRLIRFDPTAVQSELPRLRALITNLKLGEENISWYGMQDGTTDSAAVAQREMLTYGRYLSDKERDTLRSLFHGLQFSGVIKFTNVPDKLSLPHTQDRITFEFNAIETSRNSLINYQYKLEGQDEGWSPAGKNTYATYSNLDGGSYVFKVRAQSTDGRWGDPTIYNFTVRPPWWRLPGMYVLYGAILIFSLVLLVRARERSLTRSKLALEKMITQRTNEVRQQMMVAELQKEEAHKQKQEAERQRKLVEEKNAEIATQLANSEASLSNLTLQMIQRFHTLSELEGELKKLSDHMSPGKYEYLLSLVNTNKSLDKEWEQFSLYFNRIHKNFYERLLVKAKQLSDYELRICALIKMGFENREIAMVLNIEVPSVKMAKYRLKKKLQIDESVDLQTYFDLL